MAGPVAAAIAPTAIVVQADRFELNRCRCPTCARLDKRHPGQSFQLALFPFVLGRKASIARG